ncbi:MAG: hypothetical protein AABX54_04080 [Nanoarchaeota archaeon]
MAKKYGNYQQKAYRTIIERFGNIVWASESDKRLYGAYQELVDVFGDRLNCLEKSELVKTMCRNTGYSENFKCRRKKAPITLNFDGLAVIVNPSNPDNGMIYHEAVHFLGNFDETRKRLIKRDIPLAKVVGTFVRLEEKPEEEFRFLTGENPNPELIQQIQRTATNPFRFSFKEHISEESIEASLFAVVAHIIAQEKGRRAGFDYIYQNYKEYN